MLSYFVSLEYHFGGRLVCWLGLYFKDDCMRIRRLGYYSVQKEMGKREKDICTIYMWAN